MTSRMDTYLPKAVIVVLLSVLAWQAAGQDSNIKCYSQSFSETLCPGQGFTIEVTSAFYGVSDCFNQPPGSCCPKPGSDCKISVQEKNSEYYENIRNMCNGKKNCGGLVAAWTTAVTECGKQVSDYVEIFYNCVSDGNTTPPPFTGSSSSIPPLLTTDSSGETGNSTNDPGGPGLQGSFSPIGLSVGLCVGLLLALVPLLLGFLILRKRKQAEEAEIEAQKQNHVGDTNQAYETDDDESWDEDWDDDDEWENETPQNGGGIHDRRSTKKKSRKITRMSQKTNGAVINEFVHTDDIYDVIDPSEIALEKDMEKIDDVPSTKLQNGHAGTWPINSNDVKTVPNGTSTLPPGELNDTPNKVMVNNDVYGEYSDSECPGNPPPPVPTSDDVYLEPVLAKVSDEVYDHAVPYDNFVDSRSSGPQVGREGQKLSGQYDGLEFVPGNAPGMSYEALDHSTLSDNQSPSNRRQSNASDIYWAVETPDDSSV